MAEDPSGSLGSPSLRYGFAIDHSRCIGCHACSVACKEENDVPLGVYRTWVKYVETGAFPDAKRTFSVLRCNQCEDAPCMDICPTAALFRRDTGIVDFDGKECIGCKACMQACPYDALYIDPATQTAAKCHYCSHRVDRGLKPACEVVCPEQAILSGDLDEPESAISKFIEREAVTVRKPEKGTQPKVFYKEAAPQNLDPGAADRGTGYMAAQEQGQRAAERRGRQAIGAAGLWTKASGKHLDEARALADARVTYDVPHERPWGWRVSAYIWTKGISAGVVLVAALVRMVGGSTEGDGFMAAAAGLGVLFLGLTGALLVGDLKQPARFLRILTRPQWKSWLVRGAVIISGYGALLTAVLALGAVGASRAAAALLWPLSAFALATAVYTAFLFHQARGRDYWQSALLAPHLAVQSVFAGAAALLLASPWVPAAEELAPFLGKVLVFALVLDAVVIGLGERQMHRGTPDARRAASWVTHGPGRIPFWLGSVGLGHVAAILLVLVSGSFDTAALWGAGCALAGLLIHEHLWICAGQDPPLS